MNKACRLTRLDRWLLCLIAIVYSLFALHDLGVRTAPETPMALTPACGSCSVPPADVSPTATDWRAAPPPAPANLSTGRGTIREGGHVYGTGSEDQKNGEPYR